MFKDQAHLGYCHREACTLLTYCMIAANSKYSVLWSVAKVSIHVFLSLILQRAFNPLGMSDSQKLDISRRAVDIQTTHRAVLSADDELLAELGYKAEFKREFSVSDHIVQSHQTVIKRQEIR